MDDKHFFGVQMKAGFNFGFACILLCLGGGPFISTRPVPLDPPLRVAVELEGKVHRHTELPLQLTFSSDDEKQRLYTSSEFMFLILDEHGTQVSGPDCCNAVKLSPVGRNENVTAHPAFRKAGPGLIRPSCGLN
jgi:hypothetical protein